MCYAVGKLTTDKATQIQSIMSGGKLKTYIDTKNYAGGKLKTDMPTYM